MISKEKIQELVNAIRTDEQFIVEITVSVANQITVLLDSDKGITIDDCITVSRYLEDHLDREQEDFEIQVSSAGLGQPFKVLRQYKKNTGKEVEVVLSNGQRLTGRMENVSEDGFELETSTHEKVEGHKKKQLVTKTHQLSFNEIKTVKTIIKL